MSARRITRVARDDLDTLEDLTDRERVRKMTDEEIAAAAESDPDTIHPDDPWWQKARREDGVVVPPGVRGKRVSLRLDDDVIGWFQRQEQGYHGLINHVLRRYMQDEERRKRERHDAAE